ncbi:MAG: MarR family transcriptional regulator [Fusobacteriaceae bacterium]|nr:MarR family transcriptional regulator [Fusobacteriaceae bacterium]
MSEIKTTVAEQLRQLQMLMRRASFRGSGRDENTRDPHMGQGRVLAILKIKPEISQRDLTWLLGLTKQSTAQLLEKLEKSGYITRESSPEDKRVSIIKLTEEGAKAAGNVNERASGTESVLDGVSDAELAAFSETLGRIIKACEERFPDEDFEKRRETMEAFMAQRGRGFGERGKGGKGGRGPQGKKHCGGCSDGRGNHGKTD